ncbi:hypothetical protein FB45DRAFT_950921 [Roridomyces roridus]|uniref:F-box domain-containing protein n=1 Tax=Roridomyces roridus TaxID=1738132 RepID=A0AAD7F9E6_9AGAR|nr:hypothetical protein FB45DRAFT_950921 [Roridomyces roridus]
MSLPAEILNLIFDDCITDKALVATWGLVSRQHLISSRFHVFATVALDDANSHQFVDLLDAPSCDIASLIQELTLSSRGSGSGSSWFSDVLPRLPPLPNVTTLRLGTSKWVLTERMRHLLHRKLRSVTNLEICNFPFAHRAPAISFACGFVQLEELTFFPRIHNPEMEPPPKLVDIPPTLKTLALRCSAGDEKSPNWFLAYFGRDSAPELTALRVHEAGQPDFTLLARALGRLGPSLCHFSLDFSDAIVEEAFLRNYTLEKSIALRSIELTLGSSAMVDLAVTFLSTLASPVMEVLVLDIWVNPSKFARHQWEALDTLIANRNAAMKRVELRVGALFTWAPMAANIRARMPACAAWGLLYIFVDGEEC